jgi:hypothetical protein
MGVHPVWLLAFVTLIVVMGVGIWSWLSTKRHQQTGGKTSGLGGPNDPMS